MKRNNKKFWILVVLTTFLFTSCDWLLPHKIADETDELQIEDDDFLEPPEPLEEENDEKDMGIMTLHEFYWERYFYKGENNSNRFLSKRLKSALYGISDLERQTGYIILDSDPFINAQDRCFNENQMSFERIGNSNCYTFSYGSTNVTLYLVEVNGEYYIDDLLLPSGITITELYEREK
ncbi:MAG: hypothetical protein K6D59_03415 [Bacteroidales bacterium]|nr:hypothetical protein [Bacteroidales bacterium]